MGRSAAEAGWLKRKMHVDHPAAPALTRHGVEVVAVSGRDISVDGVRNHRNGCERPVAMVITLWCGMVRCIELPSVPSMAGLGARHGAWVLDLGRRETSAKAGKRETRHILSCLDAWLEGGDDSMHRVLYQCSACKLIVRRSCTRTYP